LGVPSDLRVEKQDMDSIDTLAIFFGWCTVINLGIYLLTVVSVTLLRGMALRINTWIFAISEEDFSRVSFQYVGAYKLAITVLCFTPYVALKIMS
jgi:hypothetical protein